MPAPALAGRHQRRQGIHQAVCGHVLGMGYTVEGQLTGREEFGGIQLIVYAPEPERFPEVVFGPLACPPPQQTMGMGLGAGGRMRQKIYRDVHGIDTWDQENYGTSSTA